MYITTAISYPNGSPHVGHAYEAIAADALARTWSMFEETRLLTGTDEHGLKIEQAASAQNIAPQQFVDSMVVQFQQMNAATNVEYDRFIRTTDLDHIETAQQFWRDMRDADALYESYYAGWYSVADEAYVPENELITRNGEKFTQEGRPVEWSEEPCWFFRLSRYGDQLTALLDAGLVEPKHRENEMRQIIAQGLKDVAVSRTTFQWGIPVPDSDKHIMYVWVDALVNYITGAEDHWPADVHIVGKDILKFHALYWLAFLMAAGRPLPKKIFSHGFLLHNGTRMSKTAGNIVDPIAEVNRFGSDQLRYYLLASIKFGKDGDYSEDNLVEKVNTDLANQWGNLVSRVGSILAKKKEWLPRGNVLVNTHDILDDFKKLRFQEGIGIWLRYITELNARVGDERLWEEGKENSLSDVMTTILELNTVIAPIIPVAAGRVTAWAANGIPEKPSPLFVRLDIPTRDS